MFCMSYLQELLSDPKTFFWVFVYLIALFTAIRVIMDTHSSTKTAAYILLILLLPLIGTIVYFTFGVNYRKARLYQQKQVGNEHFFDELKQNIVTDSAQLVSDNRELIGHHIDLVNLLIKDSYNKVTKNKVSLLVNGEQKFPEVARCLKAARNHIHIEYYIFENSGIGNSIKDILIERANAGVTVRVIYDAFGSLGFRENVKLELESHGVIVKPFYQVRFPVLASRINYRDHRKIIVIDGSIGFTGGINISDRYVNSGSNQLYWRDTHVKLEGEAVHSLQYHFLSNWAFCADERLPFSKALFPALPSVPAHDELVQIVCSGPDHKRASIMFAYFTAISMAQKNVFITTPYFIPNESILSAIKKAALSGKDVRLLVPYTSDSRFVDAASRFYFADLLEAGVKIYRYKKGFIHSKTMVVDEHVSFVGTANMDYRSFEMNFEVNAVMYGKKMNGKLTDEFYKDIEHSEILDVNEWRDRSAFITFLDSVARIISPVL